MGYLSLLVDVADLLFKADSPESVANLFLEKIGNILKADRTYWFKVVVIKGKFYSTQMAEWTREGVSSQANNPRLKLFPHEEEGAYRYLIRDSYFMARVSQMKDGIFKERLMEQDIKSILIVPVFIGNRYLGFVGMDNVKSDRLWSEEEIEFLKIATYLFGIFYSRYEAILELFDLRLHLDTLLNSFPDIIVIKDKEGRWLFANTFTEKFFHLEGIEYIGKTNEELAKITEYEIFKDTFVRSAETDREIIQKRKSIKYMRRYKFPDGREFYFEVRKVPIYDRHKNFKGILSIAKDITEDVKLRKQIEESERLKSLGFMAGNIAHDFNNLLTAIVGSASLLKEKLPSELKGYVDTLLKASFEARNLTSQMLSYVGNRVIEEEVFEFGREVRDVEKFLKNAINIGIELSVDVLDRDLYFKGNRAQIQQIITNLVVNASDAIGDNEGKISIKVYKENIKDIPSDIVGSYTLREGDYVVIEVKDTGPGIPEEVRKHIFEPFFSTKKKGKGLGLFSVSGIVKNYNGGIRVLSEEGRGTTFIVYLPINAPPGKRESIKEDEKITKKKFRILVVDDDPYVREILEDMLFFLGHEVVVFSQGKDALSFLKNSPNIDAAILDYSMPEMNGLELYRKIKEFYPGIRVIFSSGYAEEDLGALKEKEENIVFLQKPYSMGKLKAVLDKI